MKKRKGKVILIFILGEFLDRSLRSGLKDAEGICLLEMKRKLKKLKRWRR